MRVVYLSDAAIPSRSTNGMQTMRMCAAFGSAGADVTLAYPVRRREPPEGFTGDVRGFYGVPRSFALKPLKGIPASLVEGSGLVSRFLRALRFALYLVPLARPGRDPFVCYCRSMLAASVAQVIVRFWGRRSSCRAVVLELHDEPREPRMWDLAERMDAVVATTEALGTELRNRLHLDRDRIWVERNGVDNALIQSAIGDAGSARRDLGLEEGGGPVVCYTGRAIPGKGVDVLLAAAAQLEDVNARVVVVGKVYVDSYYAAAGTNVRFTGFLPPSQVPPYLAAADILVLPTTPDLSYASFTSPLKLLEYMTAGRPIIASDLPVHHEVLQHEENALLFPPGDALALAAAVERLTNEPELARKLANNAQRDVAPFDWTKRAERILARLNAIRV